MDLLAYLEKTNQAYEQLNSVLEIKKDSKKQIDKFQKNNKFNFIKKTILLSIFVLISHFLLGRFS